MDFFNLFGNLHGHHHHSHSRQHNQSNQGQSKKKINNTQLYKILGISKDADDKEIRKAYLKKSRSGEYRHPDKGGSEEKFNLLQQAYETLKDENKRKLYNKYGDESLKPDFREPVSMEDIGLGGLGGLFGMRQQQPTNREVKKGKPTTFELPCTLEELCAGYTKKIKITRKIIIDKNKKCCENPLDCCKKCDTCNGNGLVNKILQIGPGMIQQSRHPCDKCERSGNILKSGYSIKKHTEYIEVFIEKGSYNGDKIKIDGKGNMTPGMITSDIIIILREKEHDLFKRKGDDLLLKKDISLVDALCGFTFIVKHPDNRELVITSDKIINENDLKCIESGGMPIKGDSFCNGKLFILFHIIFPQQNELKEIDNNQLKNILNKIPSYKPFINRKTQNDLDKDAFIEEHTLTYVDPELFGKKNHHRSAHDSDSDDDNNGPQQCRQM